ncbi:MAG TPA: hypothetical protein VIL78_16265 [Hanamia sp.]
MNPDFNRFDFFTESEMTLIALKFRDENEKFKKMVMALSRPERDHFLYKFLHAFILHEGKEKQEELITKFLSR